MKSVIKTRFVRSVHYITFLLYRLYKKIQKIMNQYNSKIYLNDRFNDEYEHSKQKLRRYLEQNE